MQLLVWKITSNAHRSHNSQCQSEGGDQSEGNKIYCFYVKVKELISQTFTDLEASAKHSPAKLSRQTNYV